MFPRSGFIEGEKIISFLRKRTLRIQIEIFAPFKQGGQWLADGDPVDPD